MDQMDFTKLQPEQVIQRFPYSFLRRNDPEITECNVTRLHERAMQLYTKMIQVHNTNNSNYPYTYNPGFYSPYY